MFCSSLSHFPNEMCIQSFCVLKLTKFYCICIMNTSFSPSEVSCTHGCWKWPYKHSGVLHCQRSWCQQERCLGGKYVRKYVLLKYSCIVQFASGSPASNQNSIDWWASPTGLHSAHACVCLDWPLTVNFKSAHSNIFLSTGVYCTLAQSSGQLPN